MSDYYFECIFETISFLDLNIYFLEQILNKNYLKNENYIKY